MKNLKQGASPVWILKWLLPFTGTIHLSEQEFSVDFGDGLGVITTKPWITNWGSIDEDIAGDLVSSKISTFTLTALSDPSTPYNLESFLNESRNYLEKALCELYQWDTGLNYATDPPQLVWAGNYIDFKKPDDLLFSLDFVDLSVGVNDYVGRKLSLADFPHADPDDVGKVMTIGYGALDKIPALALDAGAVTSLPSNINASIKIFDISEGRYFYNGAVIQIDAEQILINTLSEDKDTITDCTRGYNDTIPVIHTKGAGVWEVKESFTYLYLDHPVPSIGKILGRVGNRLLDVTTVCTKYTGQTGQEKPGYPAMSVVTVPGFITVAQAVDLLVNDGISINDAKTLIAGYSVNDTISLYHTIQTHDNIGVADNVQINNTLAAVDNRGAGDNINFAPATVTRKVYPTSVYNSGFLYPERSIDGNDASAAYGSGYIEALFPSTSYGTIVNEITFVTVKTYDGWAHTVTVDIGQGGNWVSISYDCLGGPTIEAKGTNRILVAPTPKQWSDHVRVSASAIMIYEIWKEIEYVPTLTKAGNAYLTGNPVNLSGGVTKVNQVVKTGGVTSDGGVGRNGSAAIAGSDVLGGSVNKLGTVTVSGNSTANTLIGDALLICGEGWADDALGSVTGTPGLLIERPDHVFKHFYSHYGGWTLAKVYSNAGEQFAAKGYKFAGILNEYKQLNAWGTEFAWEARCWFRFAADQVQMLWRPDMIAAVKSINRANTEMFEDGRTSLQVNQSPLSGVINKIQVNFDRNWAQTGKTPYRQITSLITDPDSILRFGKKEKPDLFNFNFVILPAMAEDVGGFYLARHKNRPRLAAMNLLLENSELEFGDGINLSHQASFIGETCKANTQPGSGGRADKINLVLREY